MPTRSDESREPRHPLSVVWPTWPSINRNARDHNLQLLPSVLVHLVLALSRYQRTCFFRFIYADPVLIITGYRSWIVKPVAYIFCSMALFFLLIQSVILIPIVLYPTSYYIFNNPVTKLNIYRNLGLIDFSNLSKGLFEKVSSQHFRELSESRAALCKAWCNSL